MIQEIITIFIVILSLFYLIYKFKSKKNTCSKNCNCNSKNILKLILIVCVSYSTSFAHSIIKGKISFENNENTKAIIKILELKKNFSTDNDGNFIIENIPNGNYTLEIISFGFVKTTEKIFLSENELEILNIKLKASEFLLNDVVVTGTLTNHILKNSPVITEVIGTNEIKSFVTSEFKEIIQTHTGIEIGNTIGRNQSAMLQGVKKNHVLILIDGERISGKVDDAIGLLQIPTSNIEKIEIVKGVFSSVYGNEAIGGVINIITKQPKDSAEINVETLFGSNKKMDYSFFANFKINNNLFLNMNGSLNKYGGTDYDKNDFFMELPEYAKEHLGFKLLFREKKISLNLKTEFYKDVVKYLEGTDKYNYFTNDNSNKKFTINLNGNYILNDNSNFKVTGNISQNKHNSKEINPYGFLTRDNTNFEKIGDVKLQFTTIPYTSSILTLGVENLFEQVFSSRIENGKKKKVANIVFLEDEWSIENFVFSFGGRYSFNSQFGSNFSPKFSFLTKINPQFIFRTSYGKGFRAPSLIEQFIYFDHSSIGYKVIGNPNLKPETSNGFNFGFDYTRDNLVWFRFNTYFNNVENMIDYYVQSDSPFVLSYKNISKVLTNGIDIDIDLNPFKNFKLSFGYSFLNSEDGNENKLPFHTPNTFSTKINYTFFENLNCNIKFIWFDSKLISNEQTIMGEKPELKNFPSHSVLNINFIYEHDFTTIKFGTNNLTNKTTYPFGQIKKREFFLSTIFFLNKIISIN